MLVRFVDLPGSRVTGSLRSFLLHTARVMPPRKSSQKAAQSDDKTELKETATTIKPVRKHAIGELSIDELTLASAP